MTGAALEPDTYEADYRRFEESAAAAPSWLRELRREGLTTFTDLGMPGPRDEDWLYTNTARLRRQHFKLAPPPAHPVTSIAAHRFALGMDDGPRLVFLNGRYEASLSRSADLPEGVRVLALSEAIHVAPADVKRRLGQVAHAEMHPFAALNTAFLQDGAYIELASGCAVERPIQLLFLHAPTGQPVAVHPRILVSAGPNSKVTLVEHFGIECIGALAGGTCFTNAVAEYDLAEGAAVRTLRLQREGTRTYHVGLSAVRQRRGSRFASTSVSLGGAIDRNETRADLVEEGAECELNGLYVVGNEEHVDNHMVIHHSAPHCDSRQLYKGILGGAATGAFTGRVVVHKGAQKTNARQANHNLLLSERAVAETRPQLEIYADDVKCAHGATIGRLDEEALYYLRSRGIGPKAARNLLVHAFASEITSAVGDSAITEGLEALIAARLEIDPAESTS
jgi:Fe-S cluster assembly protein SufD